MQHLVLLLDLAFKQSGDDLQSLRDLFGGPSQNQVSQGAMDRMPTMCANHLKLLIIHYLVEAAGVEPASEIVVSQETPCSVRSIVSLPALRTDKKRLKLVR
jgi:hypothetical protein